MENAFLMNTLLAALADPARLRLVTLLAERPRAVGVLAQLAGARQPQTTKHLQTLERAGLVTSRRLGQRRVYALLSAPLRDLAAGLVELADTADQDGGAHAAFERYALGAEAERLAAGHAGWADGRSFSFRRTLPVPPAALWRHLTEPALLSAWWAPDDLRVAELVFEARPGGRVLLAYRDVDDLDGSGEVVGRATGVVEEATVGEHLVYTSTPELPDGSPAFVGHVDMRLRPAAAGTLLDVVFRITDSAIASADFVAGIETGFGQSLDNLARQLAADPDRTDLPTESDNTSTRSTT